MLPDCNFLDLDLSNLTPKQFKETEPEYELTISENAKNQM